MENEVLTDGITPGIQLVDEQWFAIHLDGTVDRATDCDHAAALVQAKQAVALLSNNGGGDAQTAA